MKTKHILELVGVVGFFGLLIWFFASKSSGAAAVTSTSSGLVDKPAVAGGDSSLQPATTSPAASATPPDLSKPDVNGNSWVNGVDQSGNPLGAVEIDTAGNFLVKAASGPAVESLKGKAHF